MRIDKIYELIGYIAGKEQFGKKLKVDDFNNLAEFVMWSVVKERYGLPERYQPGMMMPPISYETTFKIMDDMKHLKVWMGGDKGMLALDQDGRAPLPKDYFHFSSARYVYQQEYEGEKHKMYSDIELCFDAQASDRLSNPNRTPSEKSPICVLYAGYAQFYPEDMGYVEFTYLRKPKPPYYAVTASVINGEDVETYNDGASTQLELPEDMHFDFVWKMLQHIAVNIRSDEVQGYAQALKQQGA